MKTITAPLLLLWTLAACSTDEPCGDSCSPETARCTDQGQQQHCERTSQGCYGWDDPVDCPQPLICAQGRCVAATNEDAGSHCVSSCDGGGCSDVPHTTCDPCDFEGQVLCMSSTQYQLCHYENGVLAWDGCT